MGVTLTDVLLFGKAQSDDVDNATLVIYRRNILRWSALGGYLDVIVKGVSPLSLPDAIADSLSYVKAFGGTEQRNLPDGYIQRQFIYMMEDSFLLTDIVPTYDGKVEMDFQTTSVPSGSAYLLGGRTETYGGLFFAKGGAGVCIVDAFGTASDDRYTSNVSLSNNTRYKFTFNNKVATLESGGTTLFTNTFTGENANGAALIINGLNNNGTTTGGQAGIYLYSFKVWNAQGELVADYVPAVQEGTVPVVGFYDTVSKIFKTATAGTFAAGGEAVPTPDAPMDIVSNNGVLKVSRNLYNPATRTNGYYIGADGVIAQGSGTFCYSALIPVKPNTAYMLSGIAGQSDSRRLHAYDSNGNWISQISFANTATGNTYNITGTTPNNCAYVRISIPKLDTNVQLEQGSTATTYRPYGIYTDGTVETINVHSRNLFDGEYISVSSGQKAENKNPFYVTSGKKYTISWSGSTPSALNLYAYDSNGVLLYAWDLPVGSSPYFSDGRNAWYKGATFTVPENVVRLRFNTFSSMTDAQKASWAASLQIEQGTTATTYVPYYDGGQATTEMLLKVGNYQDVQSIIDGVVTRKVGVKVLDGTEDWQVNTGENKRFYIQDNAFFTDWAKGFTTGNDPQLYCTHWPFDGYLASGGQSGSNIFNAYLPETGTCYLRFTPDTLGFTTVSAWTQYLAAQYAAGTPVIIIYPLATATTESVAGQTLQVQDGDNVLEITQASLTGLELEAQYQAAVTLTIQEVQDANLDPNVEVTIN